MDQSSSQEDDSEELTGIKVKYEFLKQGEEDILSADFVAASIAQSLNYFFGDLG
jgi:hypothetical protein